MKYASLVAVALLSACDSKPKTIAPEAPVTASAAVGHAALGQPAPDFTLPDLSGKPVRLSSFRGKMVVLEWFNPGCPFVRASHTSGSLVNAAQKQAAQGVVWLAINSGAPGKQGHGVDTNREGAQRYALQHPILIDDSGSVGRAYGAERTPHMFVIDQQGVLRYEGAIDNSPDGEGKSPEGDRLIDFVDSAIQDLRAGRPVRTPKTEPYGCSVKYAS
jgi:peroxiredoxin